MENRKHTIEQYIDAVTDQSFFHLLWTLIGISAVLLLSSPFVCIWMGFNLAFKIFISGVCGWFMFGTIQIQNKKFIKKQIEKQLSLPQSKLIDKLDRKICATS